MTIIDVEEFLEDVRGKLYNMTLEELEDMVDQVKQYGFDEAITDEMISAYYNDDLDAYMRMVM